MHAEVVALGKTALPLLFAYHGNGIFSDPTCTDATTLRHAVVVFGYGTDLKTKQDFWWIKNSWGPTWGDQGSVLHSHWSRLSLIGWILIIVLLHQHAYAIKNQLKARKESESPLLGSSFAFQRFLLHKGAGEATDESVEL